MNRVSIQIIILELTCPLDTNVAIRQNHYPLINDPISSGFSADFYCFELSVSGQSSKDNGTSSVQLLGNVSKAALLGSFAIINARNEAESNVTTDLSVNICSIYDTAYIFVSLVTPTLLQTVTHI